MQTFRKEERLSGFGLIRSLFKDGTVFNIPPFRVTFLKPSCELPSQTQVLLSVPKRFLRKAVDRNLVRRRMREAYRRNKQMLYEELKSNNEQLLVCLTYTSPEILSFDQITDKIIVLLHRLMKESEKVTR